MPKTNKVYPEERADMQRLVTTIVYKNNKTCSTWFALQIQEMRRRSIFIFHRDSKIRVFCKFLNENKVWNGFIFFSILLSSIFLILETPLSDPDSQTVKIYEWINVIFTFIFTIEMIFKIIAYGFLFNWEDNQHAYARNYWNLLDFTVVVVIV